MLVLLDSADRRVVTRPRLEALDDIYTASWVHSTEEKVKHYDEVLIDNVPSFRALKHYVTGYIMTHQLLTDRVPPRYVRAYEMNKHLYE